MLNYEKLSGKASIFKTFTGLEVSEFDALYSKLEAVNPEFEEKRLARSGRKNKAGAGPPSNSTSKTDSACCCYTTDCTCHRLC